MLWHIRKISEADNIIRIAYSYERSTKCDGIIDYNTADYTGNIIALSDGADERATKRLISLLEMVYNRGNITENMYNVAIG